MRKIIASVDIGSSSIKLVVGEIQKSNLNVLACAEVPSHGIKNGYIVNSESAELAFKELFKKGETLLGLPITQVLVSIPSYGTECFLSEGSCTITSEDKVISHKDLVRAMQASVANEELINKELVSILPTKFIINDEEQVANPIGSVANKLTVHDVVVVAPSKNSSAIIKTLEKIDVKVIDVCISPLSDFYEFKDDSMISTVGAIANIGYNSTTVSIFNKGILVKSNVIDMGSDIIEKDIAYIFKVSRKDACYLKEKLVVTDIDKADPAESVTLKSVTGEEVKINQYDVSAVVISRLNELCSLIKKEINHLTKKEISYIMITGGISEISLFDRFVDNAFGDLARRGRIYEIGARHNKYSVALGMIKYYNSRMKLRNVEFSIFSEDEIEEFGGAQHRVNVSEGSILGKIFGYFFDN